MKAKSRKHLLISSIAMLLVATVALGAATYAWFTSSTTATASGVSVRTVQSSELQVSGATIDWTDTLDYNTDNLLLKPASSADGANWFTANAASKDASTADNATISDISANLDGYVFKDQLNVRNNGEAAVDDVEIKFMFSESEGGAAGKYLRVALVPTTGRGGNMTVTKEDFQAGVYAAGADTADAFTSEDGATETVAALSAASEVTISVGPLAASGEANSAKYYNLYIWFEGQDADCMDTTAGNSMPEFTFTVEGSTADQT